MPTVGNMIIGVRSKIPDMPAQIVAAPQSPTSIASTSAFTGVLPASTTFFFVVTLVYPWGETTGSVEVQGTVGSGGNALSMDLHGVAPGMVGVKVYYGLGAGLENAAVFYPIPYVAGMTVVPLVFDGANPVPGTPPVRSTAYVPDADGQTFGSGTLYEWLSDGLNKLSHCVGGLLDYCGVPTLAGNGLYVVPGQWLSITDVWYGGYWIKGGTRAEYFRRNTVTSDVLQMATISVTGAQQVIEVTYQPDRNSGVTATTGVIQSTGTSVGIGNSGAFLLPFGFAQIGTEIVAYSNLAGSTMAGLIRGLGNTLAQAWPSGTVVTELSLFWNGRRVFNTPYYPGQSYLQLPIPIGWTTILADYMLAQAKKAEQDLEASEKLEQFAFAEAEKWMYANRGVATRVQVGGNNNPVVYDQTVAGGILIP